MSKHYLYAFVGAGLGLASLLGAQEQEATPSKEKEATPSKEKEATPSKEKEVTPSKALMDPSKATEKAPDSFKVKFETTAGDFTIEVTRAWSPLGADRFYNLVKIGYFEDIAVFRAIDNFMAQFGIHGDPKVSAVWRRARIQDDPSGKASNVAGTITFATSGPNSRTTQLFLNFVNNQALDRQGFTPFGKVVKGTDNVKKIYKGYGEGAPGGKGPSQQLIQTQGNVYLKKHFPKLDYIKSVTLIK